MGVLDHKVAIVTGSGRGIGREIAKYFASEGASVVLNDLGGNPDGTGSGRIADEVVAEIRAAGGEAVPNYDTVSTMAGGRSIFKTALDAFGQCDILINNAGILRDRTIVNMSEEEWDIVFAVHMKGHFCCTQPFAQYIRETGRQNCRIVNFSSTSGLYGNFGQTNYGAAKAGIAGFTRVLALEMMKYKCTVNTIAPAAATRLTLELISARGRSVDVNDPLQGPHQLGPVITWLASDAGANVTNQIFFVSGSNLGIMQQPKVISQFVTDHLWTLEELDRAMPKLVEARKKHDEQVDKRAIARTL
jgi:NAD(P)-dependent dehydrogenase (short-subunit alcohol dehydrogenase family)